MAQLIPVPDDLQPDGALPQGATPQGAAPQSVPDDLQPDGQAPENVTVTGERPESFAGDVGDLAANVGTGVARVPGAILGVPHLLAHTLDWLIAHGTPDSVIPKGTTGADIDKYNPFARFTPSSEDVDNKVFKGISAVAGHDVQPYEPKTFIGKLLQAGVTGAGAGFLDPLAMAGAVRAASPLTSFLEGAAGRVARTAVGADAANVADQLDPGNVPLAVAAATFAHTGASAAARAAEAGAPTAGELYTQFANPRKAGAMMAGRVLPSSPNDAGVGVAAPTSSDLGNAESFVRNATNAAGDGTPATNAMQGFRDYLSRLQGHLESARSDAAEPFYGKFRDEMALTPEEMAPLRKLVDPATLDRAIRASATDMRNDPKADAPFKTWTDFNVAGDPVYRPGAMTPDLLDRTKIKLNENANKAAAEVDGGQRVGALKGAARTVTDFLDKWYPNTYPAARQAFAEASTPLQPFDSPLVSSALRQDKDALGRPMGYRMNNAELFDQLAKSKDPASVVGSFVDAAGDEKSVTGPIEDAVVGQLRDKGAIDPITGELDQKAYEREIKPFLPTLSMYSKGLMQKFGTAKQAQETLDTMRGQKAIADDIAGGAMRNGDGILTQKSAQAWLDKNRDALDKSQPDVSAWLGRAVKNLPKNPTGMAEDIADIAPAAAGRALGLKDPVPVQLMSNLWNNTLGARVRNFGDYYSKAVERAVVDPKYRQRLTTIMANKPGGVQQMQALKRGLFRDFVSQATAVPSAANAGRVPGD